ncbi:Uncharacterised protein [Pseudomonas aeruginosa]|nr:Uncharacterised protein [Pseudomonas aeruginosa]
MPPAVEHRHRVTEGEGLGTASLAGDELAFLGGLDCNRLLAAVAATFAHQKISMRPVFAGVCPSSGSFCNAWNSAQARSAWPVLSLRPAV